MQTHDAEAGPEEASGEILLLAYLKALTESEFVEKELDLPTLHRGLTAIKRNLDMKEFEILKKKHLTLRAELGRVPDFDTLLSELSTKGLLRILWKDEAELLVLCKGSVKALAERMDKLCRFDEEESKALRNITLRGVMFFRNLVKTY